MIFVKPVIGGSCQLLQPLQKMRVGFLTFYIWISLWKVKFWIGFVFENWSLAVAKQKNRSWKFEGISGNSVHLFQVTFVLDDNSDICKGVLDYVHYVLINVILGHLVHFS